MSQPAFIALAIVAVLLAAAPPLIEVTLAVTALVWLGRCPRGMLVAGLLPPVVYGVGVVVLGVLGTIGGTGTWLLLTLPFAVAVVALGIALRGREDATARRVLSVAGLVVAAAAAVTAVVMAVTAITG